MKKKPAVQEFSSLYEYFEAIPDEAAAIAYFRAIRWKNGEFCPHCGHDKIYGFSDGKTWKCAQCRQRFSIRVGTIFEDSKIELRKWFAAIWLITSHRKGVASTTLARDLKVTQKTAWFMLHRLRHAARTRSFNRPLHGIVEADEGYFGGKERNKHREKRGKTKKVVAIGLVERGGELRVKPITTTGQMKDEVLANVKPGSKLMTDEATVFIGLDTRFVHGTVNHSRGQYGDGGETHTNSIEGVWALIKRQIYGIHHFVSAKHLDRYLAEIMWRYNRRDMPDAQRLGDLLKWSDGRLTYAALIGKA
ncbi:MAG: IS1595 family transposase [Alphaproteobacteria bacterium]|nr:MAG: IS1595 family transposase [Alphaproteobacteria bacterium]